MEKVGKRRTFTVGSQKIQASPACQGKRVPTLTLDLDEHFEQAAVTNKMTLLGSKSFSQGLENKKW